MLADMFELFSERARQVIVGAQQEVSQLGHDELGTEHLLLGVLGLERDRTPSVLRSLGVTHEWARERVIALDGLHKTIVGSRRIPFTVEAKRALQSAVREARAASVEKVMPEHLLLALAAHADSLSARILLAGSIDAAAVRAALRDPQAGADDSTPGQSRQHEHRAAASDDGADDRDPARDGDLAPDRVRAGSALLIMDVQQGVVERFMPEAQALLHTLAGAVAAARAAGVTVIFVRVAFRAGAPEISARNRTFAAIGAAARMDEQDAATQIHPALDPKPDDILITKKRVSAFAGSDLDVVLRSLQVSSLTLAGIATSGVVLSTLRQAADLDYELTVLRDGCIDGDPEVHRVLMEKVFPRQASVVTAEAWDAALAGR